MNNPEIDFKALFGEPLYEVTEGPNGGKPCIPGLEAIAYRKGAEEMRRQILIDLEVLWAGGTCDCQGHVREVVEKVEW